MKKKKRITLCLISAMLAGIMVWRWKSPVNIQDKPYDKEQVSHDTEMTACDLEKEESENDRKPEVMKKDTSDRRFIDLVGEYNETRYEDLITVRYSEEEMQQLRAYMESYAGTYMTARTAYEMYSALEGEYAFECVRETDRGGYILFQGEDGSLLCVDFDNEKLILRNVWICNKFLSLKDFEGVIPYNTKEKEIYALSGGLCKEKGRGGVIQYCIVEEGTLVFYFRNMGYGWTEEDREDPLLVRRIFIPDGEEPPAGFERIPQMLPIDKHIAEALEKQESENEE
jgi:hypothetical protein